uniref:SH3 domain-containing protein n=1 Tax=Ditylenchus dipsaci TaxID=166011 RepID=A0A915DEL8_9BILA
MPANIITSYKARKIDEINKQLVNEFHPAVKNVALAGQNLVRAYDSVNKAFYLYTASLYGLSHSGKYAEKEARHHATQLQRTAESLKSIYSDHFKWVDYFANVIDVINQNNESEKERLKTMCHAYAKKEKHLVKAVDKGKMTQQDLDNFYETQLVLTMDQQFQRYNFFSQCHQDLLKKHFDWSKYSMEVLEKHLFLEEEEEKDGNQHEQAHLDELYQHAEEQQKRMISEADNAQQPTSILNDNPGKQFQSSVDYQQAEDMALDIYYDRLKAAKEVVVHRGSNSQENGTERHSSQTNGSIYEKNKSPRSLRKEFEQRNSSQASSSPRLNYRQISQTKINGSEGIESTDNEGQFILKPRSDTNFTDSHAAEGDGSQEVLHAQPSRKVLPPNIYKATPILCRQKLIRQRIYTRGSPSLSMDNRKSVNLPLNQQTTEGEELSTIYEQFKQVQQQQKQSQRSPTPYIPPSRRAEGNKTGAARPNHPPPTAQKPGQMVSAVSVTSSDGSVHVRDKSLDAGSTSRPSSANRMSHPIFCTSDYGRVLECVNPYAGQGDNQLTMDVGEKVVLVKCGTRGWVWVGARMVLNKAGSRQIPQITIVNCLLDYVIKLFVICLLDLGT